MNEQPQIRFDDGAAYETFMGVWSRSVGQIFLDWVAPPKGLSWIDVGCGNGAFTELLVEYSAPSRILGIDPSDAQLSFARERHKAGVAEFVKGDAMALPANAASFNAAVMALVIFFVPQPAKGVAEMVRVTRPGGLVMAYAWDMLGGGFPLHVIHEELKAMDLPSPAPPSAEFSRMEALTGLWKDAGLRDISTRVISVERVFPDFETLWSIQLSGPRLSQAASAMTPEVRQTLQARVRARLVPDAQGRITCRAHANAIMGRVPG